MPLQGTELQEKENQDAKHRKADQKEPSTQLYGQVQ